MSLHLHSAACEAYLTEPPEYDDPLDSVEFPRARKPGKRDRHELRRLARLIPQQRGPWVRDELGWDHNLNHACRFAALRLAEHYRYRLRVLGHLFSPYERSETLRYWRAELNAAAQCNLPPLPRALATEPHQHGGSDG